MLSAKDYKDKLNIINLYVEGCKKGDVEIMKPAFSKSAVMFSYTKEGKMIAKCSIENLFKGSNWLGEVHKSMWQINIIDATETTAIVRVMAQNWHNVGFIDHHSLVKTNDGWKIATKIYYTI